MKTLFGLLLFITTIILIIGLIKPKIILRWDKNPKRWKVLAYGFGLIIIISIFSIAFQPLKTSQEIKEMIEKSIVLIDKKEYKSAISYLKEIHAKDTLYAEAQQLIAKADSLQKIEETEAQLAKELKQKRENDDEVKTQNKEEPAKNKQVDLPSKTQKEELERELNSINKGISFLTYRSTVEALQMELVLFSVWAKMIKDGEISNDESIKKLTIQLKNKVQNIQVKEFPLIRKEYAQIAAKKMWENDVEISASGNGYKIINITGALFATNKNKKDFQSELNEIFTMFRFSQSRYRWYKGEEEYTYYNIFQGKDSDLVQFK